MHRGRDVVGGADGDVTVVVGCVVVAVGYVAPLAALDAVRAVLGYVVSVDQLVSVDQVASCLDYYYY